MKNNINKISKTSSVEYENNINEACEHIFFWKKNFLGLSSNNVGKHFLNQFTKLMDCWVFDSLSSSTALESLLLQQNTTTAKFFK